jgi:hypothetical protein
MVNRGDGGVPAGSRDGSALIRDTETGNPRERRFSAPTILTAVPLHPITPSNLAHARTLPLRQSAAR